MDDLTLISDLVRAGVDPALVGRVANALLRAQENGILSAKSADSPVDKSAEKRRAYDRERRRTERLSTGHPRMSADSAETPLTIESKKDRKRTGERLSADWKPAQPDLEFAKAKGMIQARVTTEAEKFRNYWIAKSGQAATKLDWSATWRNWVLTSLERLPGNDPGRPLTNDEKYYGVGRMPGII